MQSTLVVVAFDKFLQPLLQVLEITVCAGVDLFTLERFEKAFACGVVVGVAGPAHTWEHPVLPERLHVLFAWVLHSLVGMVYDSIRRPPISNCALQRTNRQIGFEALVESPANDFAREGIEDHCEKHVFASETDIRNISDPELIWP